MNRAAEFLIAVSCAVFLLIGCSSTPAPQPPTAPAPAPEATSAPAPTVAQATLASTSIAAPTAAQAPPAAEASTIGEIAFTSDRDDGEGDIYVMRSDGSDVRRLTDDPAYDGWPSWSPDGSQIAFCSTRSGNPHIFVMDADGSNLRQLTLHDANDIWPEWSPDGSRIAFPSRRDGNFEIYTCEPDGSGLQRLTDSRGHEDFPTWSPDGDRLVFSRSEGDDGTFVMNADGSGETKLLDYSILEPSWSPDGTRIAFGSDHEGFRGLYVMDADGSNVQKLSTTRSGENCPAWSPDGSQLVFASWRDGDGEIMVMDADGSNAQKLTSNRVEDEFPAWRPALPATAPTHPFAEPLADDERVRTTDGMVMVRVPGGKFKMGTGLTLSDSAHTVVLDGFWMDKTEVTNQHYRHCVEAGACRAPTSCSWGDPTYRDSSKTDHPVICVNWQEASDYCRWAGGQLPTEAQWEYAARGPDGHIYPWGDEFDGMRVNSCEASCPHLNQRDDSYDDGHAMTAPVGSFPQGASWCGALDMCGNVWEWVADWYGRYPITRQTNPTGPDSGTERIIRGSSWYDYNEYEFFRADHRHPFDPRANNHVIGFRCAVPDENADSVLGRESIDAVASLDTAGNVTDTISADRIDDLEIMHRLEGHTDRVISLCFAGDGTHLATADRGRIIRIWDTASVEERHVLDASMVNLGGIACSPDGRLVATADTIWDVRTGEVVHRLAGQRGEFGAVAFTPDGQQLAVMLVEPPIQLWDTDTGQLERTLELAPNQVAFRIAFSPDGALLAESGHLGRVRLWDVQTGQVSRTLEHGNESHIHGVAISPDGRILASASTDFTVRLWALQSDELLHRLRHSDGLYAVAFSPDGSIVAGGGVEKAVRLWNAASGTRLRTLRQDDEVMAVAFSPDGQLLATGGYDHIVYLYGLPD